MKNLPIFSQLAPLMRPRVDCLKERKIILDFQGFYNDDFTLINENVEKICLFHYLSNQNIDFLGHGHGLFFYNFQCYLKFDIL